MANDRPQRFLKVSGSIWQRCDICSIVGLVPASRFQGWLIVRHNESDPFNGPTLLHSVQANSFLVDALLQESALRFFSVKFFGKILR